MYQQVDGAVWNNTQPAGVYDDDGFSYSLNGRTWEQCSAALWHMSGHTNWGIVGNSQTPACGGWQEGIGRHGIIIHGDPERPQFGSEHATIIMTGPAYYRNWSKLEIFVR